MPVTTNNNAPTPDIFIAGVMKGGTTVLHDNICTHSNIEEGKQKEIHYFSLFYHEGPEWYQQHFSEVSEAKRTIDSSPTYFDATNTALIPRLIRNYTADPRVILITRDPIQRAVSQFMHMKKIVKAPAIVDMHVDEFFSQPLADAFRQNTAKSYYLNQEPRPTMEKVFSFLNEEYEHHDSFGEERYSNGSSISNISLENFNRLAELLYPDYELYCQKAGIEFKQATYDADSAAA